MDKLTENEFKSHLEKFIRENINDIDDDLLQKIVDVFYRFQNGNLNEIKKDYEPHSKEWYENYAKEKGYKLTKIADKVIESVNKSFGYCPCRYNLYVKDNKTQEEFDKILCPCVYISQDMEKCNGKIKTCHCHLFEKAEE